MTDPLWCELPPNGSSGLIGIVRSALAPFLMLAVQATLVLPASAQAPGADHRFLFQGKLLVVACDTDMLPSAYIDGKPGPIVGPDVLSIIRLDKEATSPAQLRTSSVEVTNSVTGPPAAVAVTPDGRYAIVAETQGPRPPGRVDALLSDLSPGKKLTVVDLSNPDKPFVVQQILSHERPVSITVNAAGTTVMVAFAAKGHSAVPLVLFPFANGKLGPGIEPLLPGYTSTDGLTDADFLPGGAPGRELIGVTFGSPGYDALQRARLALFTVERGILQPWGNVLDVDPSPFLVKFTTDGRFALVNSMHNFANGRGTVASIRLNESKDAKGEPVHAIVSRVETGQQPEGLAVSPDGRWVATANLETSYRPLSDPGQRFFWLGFPDKDERKHRGS